MPRPMVGREWIWSVASLGNLRDFVRVFWIESTSGIWTNVLPALLKLGFGLFSHSELIWW